MKGRAAGGTGVIFPDCVVCEVVCVLSCIRIYVYFVHEAEFDNAVHKVQPLDDNVHVRRCDCTLSTATGLN